MKSLTGRFFKVTVLLLICHLHLTSQNIGIGTPSPTSKLHLKSTIQNYTPLNVDFESGVIDDENTAGNYDWYITATDGYNSTKCAKMPQLLIANEKATLKYGFNMIIGKEVTISFNIKYDDPSNMVNFSINSDHFNYVPTSVSTWGTFTTTFVSQASSDVVSFGVKANQNEAFPIVHIDNILITYEDGHVLKIEDGTQADGLFLQSDALGQTEWYDIRGEMDQKIDNNLQNLTFDTIQNALFIEDGNGVLISSLKNDYGKSLRLSGAEIKGSAGMSFYLPNAIQDYPSFHFDATNRTMDWGVENDSIKGENSTRWGFKNTASANQCTAWGFGNNASGGSSTSWGVNNNASGSTSTAFGFENESTGWRSTTWGRSNEANALNSTSFGYDNLSSSELATTWGTDNTASGYNSTSWGIGNIASSTHSTAWGKTNEASGHQSTSFGLDNHSTGNSSTAWGVENTASANRSTAWGSFNDANALNSTAWGNLNTISSDGAYATAFGESNLANGKLSFVSGIGNKALTYAEVAIGRYNLSKVGSETLWSGDDMLFSIGNGSSDISRKNAISILKIGRVGININSPSYYLHLSNNSAAKPGSSSWTVSSDRRLKKDVHEFTDGLDIISAIEPVWFTYNGLADIPEGTYVGTIAQDLEEIAPYMVSEYTYKNGNGTSENYKAVDYGAMDFVLINAIKEQQIEITNLKAQIAEILVLLESKNDKVETKVND